MKAFFCCLCALMISRQIGSRCWVTFLMWSVIWWLIRAFFHSFEDWEVWTLFYLTITKISVEFTTISSIFHMLNDATTSQNSSTIKHCMGFYSVQFYALFPSLHETFPRTIGKSALTFVLAFNWSTMLTFCMHKNFTPWPTEDCVRKKLVYRVICVEI